MSQSLSRIVKVAAEQETTYGTEPTTWVSSEDGIAQFDNSDPVASDTELVNITEFKSAFTPTRDLVGRSLYRWQGKSYLQGSDDGTAYGPPRFNDLLTCCAQSETVDAGSSSVVYAPISTGFTSTSIATSLNGIEYLLTGGYGTYTMSGSAGQGVEINWDIQGLYNAPGAERTTSGKPFEAGFSTGTTKALTMESANLVIDIGTDTWQAGSTDELIFKSFNFNRGVTVSERRDANSADALFGLSVTAADPTLELVIEGKTAFANDVINVWTDLKTPTPHAVTFTHGTGTGNTVDFSFPIAYLTNVTTGDQDGTRIWTLTYKITHTTDNAEFSLTFK